MLLAKVRRSASGRLPAAVHDRRHHFHHTAKYAVMAIMTDTSIGTRSSTTPSTNNGVVARTANTAAQHPSSVIPVSASLTDHISQPPAPPVGPGSGDSADNGRPSEAQRPRAIAVAGEKFEGLRGSCEEAERMPTAGPLGEAIAELIRSRGGDEACAMVGGDDGDGGMRGNAKKQPRRKSGRAKRGGGGRGGYGDRRAVEYDGANRYRDNGDDCSLSPPSPSSTHGPARARSRDSGKFRGNTVATTNSDFVPPAPRFKRFGRPGGGAEIVAAEIFGGLGDLDRSRVRGGDGVASDTHRRDEGEDVGDVHPDWEGRPAVKRWLSENVVVNLGTAASILEREPRIPQQSTEQLGGVLQLLRDTLAIGQETTRSMVVRKPSLLCRSLEDNLKPKVSWLKTSFGVDDAGAGAMVRAAPNILTSNVDNMATKMTWLAQRLGISQAEMSGVIMGCPFVLTNGITTALEPRLQWLQDNLFQGEAQMRECILRNPSLIGHSLYGTLVPTFRTLADTIGMNDHRVRAVLQKNPGMFTFHLGHNFVEKQTWLRRALGIDHEDDVKDVLRAEPRLLIRSNGQLNAYLRFFVDRMGASVEDVRDAVLQHPTILMAGLDTRWAPKVTAMKERGVRVDFRRHWDMILANDDGKFDAWLESLVAKEVPS